MRCLMNAEYSLVVGAALVCATVAFAKIVPFKDADKIRSWDAWTDHKGPHVRSAPLRELGEYLYQRRMAKCAGTAR